MLTHFFPSTIVEPSPEAIQHFCYRPGQSCGKVKRAAEAIAEALAQPDAKAGADPIRHFCNRPGQSCGKAKRAAEELATAANEAVLALSE